jgi:hypothetical protein
MCVVNLVYEHNVFHACYNSFVMEMPSQTINIFDVVTFCSLVRIFIFVIDFS